MGFIKLIIEQKNEYCRLWLNLTLSPCNLNIQTTYIEMISCNHTTYSKSVLVGCQVDTLSFSHYTPQKDYGCNSLQTNLDHPTPYILIWKNENILSIQIGKIRWQYVYIWTDLFNLMSQSVTSERNIVKAASSIQDAFSKSCMYNLPTNFVQRLQKHSYVVISAA